MITGRIIGGNPVTPKSYVFQTEDGQEFVGVLVDEETIFNATANDIRQGKIAVTDAGKIVGDKVIPAYHTSEGARLVPAGTAYYIPFFDNLNYYDYTKLQAMICLFNSTLSNSVSTEKVVINDNVYEVNSTSSISVITKNDAEKKIVLGINNESSNPHVLRYFTCKEIE